jgi:ATP-dependent helicase/nuclease subunit A
VIAHHAMPAAPQYTAQQAAAIGERQASVALSAGAGCGKTFVLTQRFLSHLEPGSQQADLRTLVAITFTDRAAREMRDRIRAACQDRLSACKPDAVAHWLQILRGLDTARISTIHSFCTSLLRTHAVEAGLDPRFTVLEPALTDTLLQNTTAEVVHRLLIADDPDVVAFVLKFGLARTRDLAAALARQRFRIVWSDWESLTPEELAARWQQAWQTEFVPKLIEWVRNGVTADRVRELLTAHEPTHPVMQQRRRELLQRLDVLGVWSDPVAELAAVREAAKVQGGGGKSVWSSGEEVFEDVKESFTALRDEIDKVQKLLTVDPQNLALAAELAIHGVRLARHVAAEYALGKRATGALDFDDLLLLARDLLRDREDVRRRFAGGIRLLLVDEFQDTDPVQAEIVEHLCGAALATGKLFLVGDFKQSIYRFRRADPGVFASVRSQLPERGRLSLTKNFRSQPEILRFVNLLFAPAFGAVYEALVPFEDRQLSPQPTIEFLWATTDAEGAPDDEGQKTTVGQLREREADWIARRIAQLLSDETPRVRTKRRSNSEPELRRVQPGDIVVLFRALSNVQVYEAALRKYGVDYYLVGGKAFYAQQEVFDLLNLCQCLDEPCDAAALVGVLRSPFFGLNDDAIHGLHPADGDWWSRLQQPPPTVLPEFQQQRITRAAQVLAELRSQKDRLPIADLLQRAMALTGYDAALLAEHLGRRKVANLRKLIDQAAAFDRGELFTLKDFVQRLQTSVLDETDEEFATTLPETGEVVRLMSVHQAKGLEFPVVFVADINRKGHPQSSAAHLHPEWGALVRVPEEFGVQHEHLGLRMLNIQESEADEQESLRLFYVATTRAADHLILSAGLEPDLTPQSPWLKLLAERFALDTGLPKHDPLLGTMIGATERAAIPEIRMHREPPPAEPVQQSRDHRPLSEFATTLLAAEPEPLPASAQVFPADATAPRWWSVSQLEELLGKPGFSESRASRSARLPKSSETSEVFGNGGVAGSDQREGPIDEAGAFNATCGITGPSAAILTPPSDAVFEAAEREARLSEKPGFGAETSTAEILGTLFHRVMERVDFAATETWDAELAECVQSSEVAIEAGVADAARAMLQRFAASELPSQLAAAEHLWREVDFVLPWPSQRGGDPELIVGQIDCCFVTPAGTWHVWDFKTGVHAHAVSDAEILAPYQLQLGLYALAVERWWGRALDSLELVLLRPKVRCVPWRFDAAARERVTAWVEAAMALGRDSTR